MSSPVRALSGELQDVSDLGLETERPLGPLTTLKIGGPAALFASVGSETALVRLLEAAAERRVPVHLLGLGSNVLFPDGGLDGVVARLTGPLAELRFDGRRVRAGGGAPLPRLARRASARGLAGLEALAGFPSTVGGAVAMNAGSYGAEIRDVIETVRVVGRDGRAETLAEPDLEAGYRSTVLQRTGAVVVEASLELAPGDAARLLGEIQRLNRKRWSSLPSGEPHAGSVFKNPDGDYAGRLIESCGLKGARRGGAAVSEKHANVIVNREDASADDFLALMVEVRRAVEAEHGVVLEPELVLAGDLGERWRAGR